MLYLSKTDTIPMKDQSGTLRLQDHKSPFYNLKKIWNPSWFQGNRKKRNYFEGWYFKMVDKTLNHAWAVIPGISLHHDDPHAFIQVINGKTGQTWYFRFPKEAFLFSRQDFYVEIGNNSFSKDHIKLDINEKEGIFKGELRFENQVPFRASLKRPGIMGWYRYAPFMECYHGVVSLNHSITGEMIMNGDAADFNQGIGYIEKDWGSSMPKSWVWMQSNHFEKTGVSFMLSVADIPWIGKSFEGFLGFLLLNDEMIPFATYTGAKITHLNKEKDQVEIQITTKKHVIDISGIKDTSIKSKGALKAPVSKGMDRVIHENINARLEIKLNGKDGQTIFHGTGSPAGLEIVDDSDLLSSS